VDLTSQSLLLRAREGSEQAWTQLFDLYRPFIQRWLQRFTTNKDDADDLCQDVLLTVHQQLPGFDHNGQPGAFRSWLRVITTNRARIFQRGRDRAAAAPGPDFASMAEQLADPNSDLGRVWQKEHDEHVLNSLLQTLGAEFEPATIQVFRRLTLEGVPAAQLAEELGLTIGTIYVLKSRVLHRLREVAQELLG